jgi:preprotein translocase subunit SecA
MVTQIEMRVQRPLHYAIVDEVDSILVDEARTPLIISGQAEDSSAMYRLIDTIIPRLKRSETEEGNRENREQDFWIDEKNRQIEISEKGYEKIEKDASELEDAKIKMTAKVDFLATSDKKGEEEIPLSPTEEEQEKPKDQTMRNLAMVGGIVALGVIAWYFTKKKE